MEKYPNVQKYKLLSVLKICQVLRRYESSRIFKTNCPENMSPRRKQLGLTSGKELAGWPSGMMEAVNAILNRSGKSG